MHNDTETRTLTFDSCASKCSSVTSTSVLNASYAQQRRAPKVTGFVKKQCLFPQLCTH